MKIVSLVENSTKCDLQTAHGLSLYIETKKEKILFDLGQDDALFNNAKALNIDLRKVGIVIISHGHKDHGGALAKFLEINNRAKIYIQKRAFLPHFSHRATGIGNISLDSRFIEHPQVVLVDGDFKINDSLELFVVKGDKICLSSANNSLYEGEEVDNFLHEQNLAIKGDENVVIMGCGHNGVVNIMKRAAIYTPKIVIGGFHLTNPSAGRNEPTTLLDQIVEELKVYDTTFYTCHCTGIEVFEYMAQKMKNIEYLACGDKIERD